MGLAPSGRYWIGVDGTAARKGLLLHFKDRSVLTMSQQNLIDLLDQSHNIVYNPTNMKTTIHLLQRNMFQNVGQLHT